MEARPRITGRVSLDEGRTVSYPVVEDAVAIARSNVEVPRGP
jgi:hypothetical protein